MHLSLEINIKFSVIPLVKQKIFKKAPPRRFKGGGTGRRYGLELRLPLTRMVRATSFLHKAGLTSVCPIDTYVYFFASTKARHQPLFNTVQTHQHNKRVLGLNAPLFFKWLDPYR
jgi:hypothetical protein